MLLTSDLVVWNNKVTLDDKSTVGIEIASLGELAHHNIPILHRIVVTPYAYSRFLLDNNLTLQLKHLLGSLNHERHDSVTQVAGYIRRLMTKAEIKDDIYLPLFKLYEHLGAKNVTLQAYYFQGATLIAKSKWEDISGEAVLAESIRVAYSHLFTPGNLSRLTIHHGNHHSFSVCLSIEPVMSYEITGEVRTFGKGKGEYEIEAHNLVHFTFNKRTGKVEKGYVLPGGSKIALTPHEIKKLLNYAINGEKALYLPHVLYWGKFQNDFLVTKALASSQIYQSSNSFSDLEKIMTVHPGISIGRLRVISEKDHSGIVLNDEIVVLKTLDKNMLDAIKKAKGLIVEEEPHPEVAHALRSYGIPTVIKKKESLLYSTGDIVTLNATTGEVKRGSLFVS